MKKKGFKDALRIWVKYLEVQKQIVDSNYTVEVHRNCFVLTGNLKGKLWEAAVLINPYDRHSPHIESEYAVPYWNGEELFTSELFHDRCGEALAKAEEKAGIKYKMFIDLIYPIGLPGLLPKICEAIDDYDKANSED